jgi:hypothetical protein
MSRHLNTEGSSTQERLHPVGGSRVLDEPPIALSPDRIAQDFLDEICQGGRSARRTPAVGVSGE